jgi:hypothetical protein
MNEITELYETIETITSKIFEEKEKVLKGNKSAAQRTRKLTLELEPHLKRYRKITIHKDEEVEN